MGQKKKEDNILTVKKEKKKRKGRLIKAFFIIAFLFLTALYLFILSYQKNIKQAFIEQLNKYLLTEVTIADVKVSVFKKFPNVSLVLEKVRVPDPESDSVQLARFDEIFLTLNIIEVLKKNYVVEKLIIDQGMINIRIDKNGHENFRIWKESEDVEDGPAKMVFELKKILFNKLDFDFQNQQTGQILRTHVNNLNLKGNFKNEKFKLTISADADVISFLENGIIYLKNNHVEIKTGLQVNQTEKSFSLKNAHVHLDDLLFDIRGSFIAKPGNSTFDLSFNGNKIDLLKILSVLPESTKQELKNYKTKGFLDIKGTVKGNLNNREFPSVNVGFTMNDGLLTNKKNGLGLEKIILAGNYTNGDKHNSASSILKISQFSCLLDENKISGNLVLNDLDDPYLNTELKSVLDLKKVYQFLDIDAIESMTGMADIDLKYRGKLSALKANNNNLNSRILVNDLNIQFRNESFSYQNLNGQLDFNGKDLTIKDLTGNISESDFRLNGIILNFLPFLTKQDQKLIVSAKLDSRHFNLDRFLNASPGNAEEDQHSRIPEFLILQLKVNCDELDYGNFKARQVHGYAEMSNQEVVLKDLRLRTSEGRIILNGETNKVNNKFLVHCKAQLEEINIRHLFYQFNNFGQDFLTHKHLEGTLNSILHLNAEMNQQLQFDLSTLFVTSEISILNGRLIEFKPIMSITGFIKLKKMRDILFDKLENSILIIDETITIPNMEILSSAMSMSVSGSHSFKNDIDYHFRINLSELFLQRNKTNIGSLESEKDENRGGINLFVHMFGTTDDYQLKLDKKAVKNKINKGIEQEKKEFKELFQFKKNKEKLNSGNKEDEYEFEWDDK